MSLKGPFVGLEGRGTGGTWLGDKSEYFTAQRVNELRQALYLFAAGTFHRSVPIGGSRSKGLRYTGAIDAIDAVEFTIDNTSNGVSGSLGVIAAVAVLVRVENAALAVTPRLYNLTLGEVATVTGAAACTATAEDYSGTNQRQILLVTLPTGVHVYKLQFVSTGAAYQFWGQGWRGLYS